MNRLAHLLESVNIREDAADSSVQVRIKVAIMLIGHASDLLHEIEDEEHDAGCDCTFCQVHGGSPNPVSLESLAAAWGLDAIQTRLECNLVEGQSRKSELAQKAVVEMIGTLKSVL